MSNEPEQQAEAAVVPIKANTTQAEAREIAASLLPPEIKQRAAILIASGLFDVDNVSVGVAKLEFGQALGINDAQAMKDLHIVKGNLFIGATLLASAVKRKGKYNYRVEHIDNDYCEIAFWELINDEWREVGCSKYTIEDAKTAQVWKTGSGWTKNPRNMLFARALSNGARWFCPDAIGSAVYTTEEIPDAATWPDPTTAVVVEGADDVVEAEVVDEPMSAGQAKALAGAIEISSATEEQLTLKTVAMNLPDMSNATTAQADELIAFLGTFPPKGSPEVEVQA